MRFLVGHGPNLGAGGKLQVSADAFRETERKAKMQEKGSYRSFWHLYGLARLVEADPARAIQIVDKVPPAHRKRLQTIFEAKSGTALIKAIQPLLILDDIGTLTQDLLERADDLLLQAKTWVTLAYDGLDTGFEIISNDEEWIGRQKRFTTSLLQVMTEARSKLRRLSFKIFLREDIFLGIDLQNKSHLVSLHSDF